VDWYAHINYSIDEEEEYQAEVLNPLIAGVQFNPDYPQNFTVTGLQEGTTEIVVRLVSDSSKSLTIPVTVVEELPPSITTEWPDEYLNLIMGELSDEIIPIEGTSYIFEPSMVLGDFYHFIIDHPSKPIDFVDYAIMMMEHGWNIVRYVPNSTQFTKNNVSVSLGYNSTLDQVHLQIKKQGDPFVKVDVTRQMNQIISGKIHEDVSLLPLPDFEFYEYVTSLSHWQHPQSELINVFGYYLNDTEFSGEGYATELLELGFTTVTERDQVWYIDPNECYMVFYGFNEHFIQFIIQSTDYYEDPYHFDHDVERFR
jgi:hypothetical protein